VIAMLLLAACSPGSAALRGGGNGGDVRAGGGGVGGAGAPPASGSANGPTHQVADGTGFGGNGTPDGGGGSPDGGGNGPLGGPGLVNAAPTVQQSLFDYTQTGVAAWGPVVQTVQVMVNGQAQTATRLASSDPFIATWQLPGGDLVISNKTPQELVNIAGESEPLLPTEPYPVAGGTRPVYPRQVFVNFKPAATQQDIEALIALHGLYVVASWFEPPEVEGQGNAIAILCFRYPLGEFTGLPAAVAYFDALPIAEGAFPSFTDLFELEYAQEGPDDAMYDDDLCRQVNIFGVDTDAAIDMGPPWGAWIARTTVAILDVGVTRLTQDFGIPGFPPNYKKVSWNGISSSDYYENVRVGFDRGNPPPAWQWPDEYPLRPGAQLRHGTQCAGTITACTENWPGAPQGVGVAGLAPQIGILPVRLTVVRNEESGRATTTFQSLFNAYVALRKQFQPAFWYEEVRVASYSSSAALNPAVKAEKAFIDTINTWISRDSLRCNRLTVASAGNEPSDADQNPPVQRYPAALPVVLGVSGLVCNAAGSIWREDVVADNLHYGSSYFEDANQPDIQRLYPVSGIYAVGNTQFNDFSDVTYVPATLQSSDYSTHYYWFGGTSFAAPQASALAALLWLENPGAQYWQVSNQIVQTRDTGIESYMENTRGVQLAGLIDFGEALSTWP
jgi:Subtilase family